MLNRIMKQMGEAAFSRDLARLDESKRSPDVKELYDVSYLPDGLSAHTLDICYLDDGASKPILIDIHGGGFISHGKEADRLFGNCMAQRGFVVFLLNFRLAYPVFHVFDQIEDISNAVRWVTEHAAEYGGNATDMYLAGHSSGGVLALAETLLCLDPSMVAQYRLPDRAYRYNGVLLDCGLLAFYKKSPAYWGMRNMVFPKGYKTDPRYKALLFDTNPILRNLPKTVLMTNCKDELKAMTYSFDKLLAERNVPKILFDTGSDGHMGILFKPYSEENRAILDQIVSFWR